MYGNYLIWGYSDMACPVCGGEKIIECIECSGKGRRFALWPSRLQEELCFRCEGLKQIECPVCSAREKRGNNTEGAEP